MTVDEINTRSVEALLAYDQIKGFGLSTFQQLVPDLKDEVIGINTLQSDLNRVLSSNYAITEDQLREKISQATLLLETLDEHGIEISGYFDDLYPKPLRTIDKPPIFITWKGNEQLLSTYDRSIAIVGSRKASKEVLVKARELARRLASKTYNIVSGLALGVDSQAHSGALEGDGYTTAVLPGAIDKIRPSSNKQLSEGILGDEGLLLSEYLPEQRIYKSNYIARNRLQSGLSSVVIIVETGESSGTMKTANFALEQERTLIAVKYDTITSDRQGNLKLSKDGRCHYMTGDQIIDQIDDLVKRHVSTKRAASTKNTLLDEFF